MKKILSDLEVYVQKNRSPFEVDERPRMLLLQSVKETVQRVHDFLPVRFEDWKRVANLHKGLVVTTTAPNPQEVVLNNLRSPSTLTVLPKLVEEGAERENLEGEIGEFHEDDLTLICVSCPEETCRP
jgi:hypothetical protein